MATARQLRLSYTTKRVAHAMLIGLLITAGISLISISPGALGESLMRHFLKHGPARGLRLLWPKRNRQDSKRFTDTFSYLKSRGFINVTRQNHQIYVSLTEQGKKRAKYFQINDLEIAKPRRWDKKWRLLIFDIPERTRFRREGLRGKLKEMGFAKIQRSVWVHPYPCADEIELLRIFFGLKKTNLLVLEVESLNYLTEKLTSHFRLTDTY